MTSYEPALLRAKPSARLDGREVLALAERLGVTALLFNWVCITTATP